MNESAVKRLGLILSVQAEIEAMKVENLERNNDGNVAAYDGTNFWYKAEELRLIVAKPEDQL